MVLEAQKAGTPIIASMGTGNKHHPELLEVSDIFKTSVCPLAKVMRYELKKARRKETESDLFEGAAGQGIGAA